MKHIEGYTNRPVIFKQNVDSILFIYSTQLNFTSKDRNVKDLIGKAWKIKIMDVTPKDQNILFLLLVLIILEHKAALFISSL